MGHKHSVYDSDAHFSIDPITRKIKNESSKKTTLVQGDHNSERCTFDVPRFIEGHDMLQCSEIEVHYDNFETGTSNVSSDYYEVKDKQISPDDPNVVIFSWLIIDTATEYAGTLEFSIKFKCVEDGVSDYEWNTLTNTDLTVGKGKNNSGVVVERAPNVVDQWKDEIFGDAENAVANINLAEKNALTAVQKEGAAQVAAIQAEGSTQVENVKAAAAAIEADRDQIHLNHALKAAAIVGNAEGEMILLDDSAEQPFVEMSVFGKSTQETTEGKQLFKHIADEMQTFSAGGATVTNNGDGSFTVSGSGELTATASRYHYYTHAESIQLFKAGKLCLKCEGETTNPKVYIHPQVNNQSLTTLTPDNVTEFEITQEMIENETFRVVIGIYANSGTKIVAGTFRPTLYQEGDGTWEAFTGGIPSPNPEYPQEINSVENPEVDVCGKNLLNSDIGYFFTYGSYKCYKVQHTEQNVTLKLWDKDTSVDVSGCYAGLVKDLDKPNEAYSWALNTGVVIANQITRPYNYMIVYPPTEEALKKVFNRFDIQVEIGDSATEYEDFKENQVLSLPYTLHGIQTESGLICDEVDLERGVLVQRIGSYTITGNEDWYLSGLQNLADEGIYRYDANYVSKNSSPVSNAMSTHYPYPTRINLEKGCWVLNDATQALALRIMWSYATVDDLKTFLKEQYEQNTPVVVNYILAEPIETALSEAEIEAFKALVTKYPYTTILNDCGANMAVRYGIDTKTYIDKKFEELKNTILSES